MQIQTITSFATFTEELRKAGFSMAGDNHEGIFSLSDHFSDTIIAHTGEPDSDPWAWRMRVLNEFDDLFYSKVFFKKGGFITGEWYPYFYVIRRKNQSFKELYEAGRLSYDCKQVYEIIDEKPNIALHEIALDLATCVKSKSKIESALTTLQMFMLVTISGEKYKLSKEGNPYGWPVTTFNLVDQAVNPDILKVAETISFEDAVDKVKARIKLLNPGVLEKDMKKFLFL